MSQSTGTATDPATTAPAGQDNQPGKVTFTPEQQEKINDLIKNAMGRAGSEHKERATALQAELESTKAELVSAQETLKTATTAKDKAGAKADVEALQAQIEEMKRAGDSLRQEADRHKSQLQQKEQEVVTAKKEAQEVRKLVAIQNAASKLNFVNADVVVKLTKDAIKYHEQDGRFIVLNEQGQERLNASYEPMSLEEFYTEFATNNAYLVRGDVKPGVGSTEGGRFGVAGEGKFELKQIFGKDSDAKLANKLKKENPKEYARLKEQARASGLLA